MIQQFTILGLFCEDIREEQSGIETLVGILPDNISVPSVPGMMPKLCVYVRINFPPSFQMQPGTIVLRFPDGVEAPVGDLSDELIATARENTIAEGGLLAGIKSRATLSGLTFKEAGRLHLIAKLGDKEYLCGSLNIKVANPPQE
jgi:hypothetical protein